MSLGPSNSLLYKITFLFVVIGLLPGHGLAQGKLALFLDFYCKTPSQLAPSVSLPLSTCLVPVGAVSVAIQLFPACDSGTASMIMYEDTGCARDTFGQIGDYTGYSPTVDNCFYRFISDSIPAVMFTCEEPASHPQPTSTLSITASGVAGVATAKAGGSTAGTTAAGNPAPTTQQGASTKSTGSPAPSSEAGASSTGGTGSSEKPSDTSKTSYTGLSRSDQIAIGVGVGGGLLTCIFGILAWRFPPTTWKAKFGHSPNQAAGR